MTKATRSNGHLRHHHYDLHRDYKKIKSALADTRKDVAGKVQQMFHDSIETAKDKSLDMQDSLADYIAEKPFKAVGVAALAGLVVGFLLRK